MKMSKTKDRRELVKKINHAAALYKEFLVGKRFLYVFEGRYIEVIYKAENFRHLTGVESFLSAKHFYKLAVKGTLAAGQITFTPQHPFDLCVRKVKHIEDVATLACAESFMLEEISTSTTTYKFGTTNLNFTLCMNIETDDKGVENSECYIAQSLRDGYCFSKSKDVFEVSHILRRGNDEKRYNIVLYQDGELSLLPEEIRSLIDPALLGDAEE